MFVVFGSIAFIVNMKNEVVQFIICAVVLVVVAHLLFD